MPLSNLTTLNSKYPLPQGIDASTMQVYLHWASVDRTALTHILQKHPHLDNYKPLIQAACSVRGHNLRHASAALRDDRSVVAIACHNHGMALQYASARLQAHWRIARIAMNNTCRALEYIDPAVRTDERIYPDEFFRHSEYFDLVPQTLRHQSHFYERFLNAPNTDVGSFFRDLDPALLTDETFCKMLLDKGAFFSEAPIHIRANKALFLHACKVHQNVYKWLDPSLQQDADCLMAAIALDEEHIHNIQNPDAFWTIERARILCAQNDAVYKRMPLAFREDFECAKGALTRNPYLYELLPKILMQQHELALLAVSHGNVLHMIRAPLNQDAQIVQAAIDYDASAMCFVAPHLRTYALCYDALHHSKDNKGYCYEYFPSEVKADPDIAKAAFKLNGMQYQHAPESIQNDTSLMIIAVHEDVDVFDSLPAVWKTRTQEHLQEHKRTHPKKDLSIANALQYVVERERALSVARQMEQTLDQHSSQHSALTNVPPPKTRVRL